MAKSSGEAGPSLLNGFSTMVVVTEKSSARATERELIRLELLRMIVKSEARRAAERKAPSR